MKRLMMVVLSMTFAVGMAIAGNIDSPGDPSAGSGMYTLQNLYDYLMSGTALTIASSFQEPTAGPASTMKSTKQIGDDVKGQFVLCDATAADVKLGKKFFSTQAGSWGVKTGTGAQGIVRSGATVSYQNYDDAYYADLGKGNAFNFADNGDGTITDHNTNLMWAKDGTGAGCRSGGTIQWSSAIVWAEALVFPAGGYSDWRLPNVRELESIMDYGKSSPALNTTYFTNTVLYAYWVSTSRAAGTTKGLCINMGEGDVPTGSMKTNYCNVRAVRDCN